MRAARKKNLGKDTGVFKQLYRRAAGHGRTGRRQHNGQRRGQATAAGKVNTVSQGACGKKHRRRFFISRKAGIEIMAEIMSEQTKEMTEQQRRELQEKVAAMSPEELRAFRNEQDADSMGFRGKECF